jgi:hypothetical protein
MDCDLSSPPSQFDLSLGVSLSERSSSPESLTPPDRFYFVKRKHEC